MKIYNSEFIKSCVKIEDCPNEKAEFAFVGRSNVGKSSLINMLTGRKKLANISSKPGKTQTINYFLVNYLWYLVDLPGYGYAKVSKKMKLEFDKIVRNYLFRSSNLLVAFVLVDSSIKPQKNDLEFINKLGRNEIPIAIIFTKSDKLSKEKINKNIFDFNEILLESWTELPPQFVCSTVRRTGKDEILGYIDKTLKHYK